MLNNILYSMAIIFVCFISNEYSLLCKLITLDSLFSAIYFITNFINKNLSDSQILRNTSLLYRVGILDRYIYYILLSLCYKIINIFLWTDNIIPLYYFGIISIIPYVLNRLYKYPMFCKIIKF